MCKSKKKTPRKSRNTSVLSPNAKRNVSTESATTLGRRSNGAKLCSALQHVKQRLRKISKQSLQASASSPTSIPRFERDDSRSGWKKFRTFFRKTDSRNSMLVSSSRAIKLKHLDPYKWLACVESWRVILGLSRTSTSRLSAYCEGPGVTTRSGLVDLWLSIVLPPTPSATSPTSPIRSLPISPVPQTVRPLCVGVP